MVWGELSSCLIKVSRLRFIMRNEALPTLMYYCGIGVCLQLELHHLIE